MISLFIKTFLIIDNLEINFKEGFNTLTGETGTGKSILVDCLSFALGENSADGFSSKMKKKKQSSCLLSLFLKIVKYVKIYIEAGFNIEQEPIIRRLISVDGKKIIY